MRMVKPSPMNLADVADLAAAFGVERRLIQGETHGGANGSLVDFFTGELEQQNLGGPPAGRSRQRRWHPGAAWHRAGRRLEDLDLLAALGNLGELIHALLETRLIQGQAFGFGQFFGDLVGETVGGEQLKGIIAGKGRGALRLMAGHGAGEEFQTATQGAAEGLLFAQENLRRQVGAAAISS